MAKEQSCDITGKYKTGVIGSVMLFKRDCPYASGDENRWDGLCKLTSLLNNIYGITPSLAWVNSEDSHSFNSYYNKTDDVIVMVGRLSIITFLHEYAHARGMDEKQANAWSMGLFKRVYPQSYLGMLKEKLLSISRQKQLPYNPQDTGVNHA